MVQKAGLEDFDSLQKFVHDEKNLVRMKQFLDLEERMTEEYNFLD